MNKFYDKILFVLGLLLLLGGVGFYLTSSDQLSADIPPELAGPPTGTSYAAVKISSIGGVAEEWVEPAAQSAGPEWIYDVFTPPIIYFDETTREFLPQPPRAPDLPPPFGVELVEVKRDLYRLQLEGYLDAPSGDPADATLIFANEETGAAVRGAVGMDNDEVGFSVVSFAVPREEVDGLLRRVPTVTIFDKRIQREVVLTTIQNLYLEDSAVAVLEGTGEDRPRFEIESNGESFTIGSANFTVTDISFDNQSVTVKKTAPELEEPQERSLQARGERARTSAAPVRQTPSQQTQEIQDVFKDLFN